MSLYGQRKPTRNATMTILSMLHGFLVLHRANMHPALPTFHLQMRVVWNPQPQAGWVLWVSGHNVKGKSKLSESGFDEGHGHWTAEKSSGGSWLVKSPPLSSNCLTQLSLAIKCQVASPNLCHSQVSRRINRRQSSNRAWTQCMQMNAGSKGWLDPCPLRPHSLDQLGSFQLREGVLRPCLQTREVSWLETWLVGVSARTWNLPCHY